MLNSLAHEKALFFESPLFFGCTDQEIEKLKIDIQHYEFAVQDVLVREGEDLDVFGILTSGIVMAERKSTGGGPIRLILPMEMVGRPDRCRSAYDLRVVSKARICGLPRSSITAFLDRNPSALIPFLSYVLHMIGTGREWIWLAYQRDADQKVALCLAFILHSFRRASLVPEGSVPIIPLPITRSEMGDLLGLGMFTVSRHLNALREDGIIEFPGQRHVAILKPEALYSLAGLTMGIA